MTYAAHRFLYDLFGIYLSGLFFIAPTRSQKTIINFGTFVMGVLPGACSVLDLGVRVNKGNMVFKKRLGGHHCMLD